MPTTDLSAAGTVCAPCAIVQVSGAVEKASSYAGCGWCVVSSSRADRTAHTAVAAFRVVLEVPAVAWLPTTDLSFTGTACAPCAIVQESGAVEKAAFVAGCDWCDV